MASADYDPDAVPAALACARRLLKSCADVAAFGDGQLAKSMPALLQISEQIGELIGSLERVEAKDQLARAALVERLDTAPLRADGLRVFSKADDKGIN